MRGLKSGRRLSLITSANLVWILYYRLRLLFPSPRLKGPPGRKPARPTTGDGFNHESNARAEERAATFTYSLCKSVWILYYRLRALSPPPPLLKCPPGRKPAHPATGGGVNHKSIARGEKRGGAFT